MINALLPSPNYHLPQFTSPHKLALPERTAFQEKGGRLLERFTKHIQGSHDTLQYYIQQHKSTLFSISYDEDKGSDVLEALRHPESRSPLCEAAVKLLAYFEIKSIEKAYLEKSYARAYSGLLQAYVCYNRRKTPDNMHKVC